MSKRFFAKHAKSSAMMVSLAIHGILLVVALSFVAVTVITKEDQIFEAVKVKRPKMALKKLQVPVNIKKKKTQKPKLRKRIVVKPTLNKVPDIKMPEITGVKGGMAGAGDGFGGAVGIGFTLPELDFFGAKAKGEKVVFVVHFGPATIGGTPLKRMTGYVIRKRLEDLVNGLPDYTLFNVACYWMQDTWAMNPEMMLASPANKQKVRDWMAPVNPLQGDYGHCFVVPGKMGRTITQAAGNYPEKIDSGLPFYSPKWVYPYVVPGAQAKKYLPASKKGYVHWSRGVSWAVLEQKADTIFILTTNYIDGFGSGDKGRPEALVQSYKKMFADVYGPDKKRWPTINVVVLKHTKDPDVVLNAQFGPVWKGTRGDGSVIDNISKFMNDEEKELYKQLASGDASALSLPEPAPTIVEQPPTNEKDPTPTVAAESGFPMNPILGKWKFKFDGAKKYTTRQFTADGKCIQRNQRGKIEWESGFSMRSAISATTVRNDMLHELQSDGTLRLLDNLIATRVE
ncbi:hypothetical protein PDESU_04928 [Pontiella desulfatans]|uniref:Uncharacterized protein n=1 Tax=Pontiella desulfatans TaxID=2750659 RepID=A0A6C2U9D9_PONDE|nr:hypothetical protein [Pontiella desulfatans]VGO16337.1 hypothetical protein PDESU_04928 [Pontiella desulfatans]